MDDKELIQVALGVNSPWYVKVPKKRAWRHLDFFHYEPHLHVRVPRTKCSEHGIKIINLSWARSNSGFSLFFETLIVALCKEMPVSAVADISNIHEDSIWRILAHYVDKARENVDLSELDTIGVDELSVKKDHQYITLFYDLKDSRVIHIEDGKKREVFKGLRDKISEKIDPEQVKYLSMDVYPAYKGGAKEFFPNAKITFDNFQNRLISIPNNLKSV